MVSERKTNIGQTKNPFFTFTLFSNIFQHYFSFLKVIKINVLTSKM